MTCPWYSQCSTWACHFVPPHAFWFAPAIPGIRGSSQMPPSRTRVAGLATARVIIWRAERAKRFTIFTARRAKRAKRFTRFTDRRAKRAKRFTRLTDRRAKRAKRFAAFTDRRAKRAKRFTIFTARRAKRAERFTIFTICTFTYIHIYIYARASR